MPLSDPPTQLTLTEISLAIDQLFKRIGALEAAMSSGGNGQSATAIAGDASELLSHVFNWARHFGMPDLPRNVTTQTEATAQAQTDRLNFMPATREPPMSEKSAAGFERQSFGPAMPENEISQAASSHDG